MTGRVTPMLPHEARFADAIGNDVIARAEAAGISAGLLVILLGRIAGLVVSAAGIDGARRDAVLREMRREAEAMARDADGVRGAVSAMLLEEGHA
mgnify:CR=1 FL=1